MKAFLAAAAAVGVFLAGQAAAQDRAPTSLAVSADTPRTADGKPDLQNEVWLAPYFTSVPVIPAITSELVAPESENARIYAELMARIFDDPTFGPIFALDPEAEDLMRSTQGLPVVRGERRTRLIVAPAAGRPPWTPATLAAMPAMIAEAGLNSNGLDNPEQRPLPERCLAQGATPPMAMISTLHPRQFVVTADHVVLQVEYGDEVRIIPFTDEHGPAVLAPSMGDSIARWDGDTLEIRTTHNPEAERVRFMIPAGLLIVRPEAVVVERYTRVSPDELLYQYTVEDPETYRGPWLAEYSLYRSAHRMLPSTCHENNYSIENILAGARYEEGAYASD